MKPTLPLVALGVLLLAACSKSPSGKPGEGAAPASEPPKRNMSESLGFVSAEPDSYSAPPPPSSTPPQPSPSPSAPPAPPPTEAAPAPAALTRTLTNRDGRTVEAVLLSRTASTVKIRRKADSVEFTIPLDRLSDADQAFIRGSSLPLMPGN